MNIIWKYNSNQKLWKNVIRINRKYNKFNWSSTPPFPVSCAARSTGTQSLTPEQPQQKHLGGIPPPHCSNHQQTNQNQQNTTCNHSGLTKFSAEDQHVKKRRVRNGATFQRQRCFSNEGSVFLPSDTPSDSGKWFQGPTNILNHQATSCNGASGWMLDGRKTQTYVKQHTTFGVQ